MTYYELKNLKRRVDTQKLKVAALREQSISVSCAADGLPHGGQVSDKVGVRVGQILAEEERLNILHDKLTDGIQSVPDVYIQTLIHCKLIKNWSWTRIAMELGGNNTGDGLRKTVVRYHWDG